MMITLYRYFEIVGILSIAAWVSAVVLLVMFARREPRNRFYLLAFGLAVAGWVLGLVNSGRIDEIQVDRTREYEEGRREQQRKRIEMLKAGNDEHKVTDVQFAEDAAGEKNDLAGLTTNEVAFVNLEANTNTPAYRLAGKPARDVSRKESPGGPAAGVLKREARTARTLPESDVIAANNLDRFNRVVLRLILWLSGGLVIWDYLRRFNRTAAFYFPLPLTGPWIDDLSPKVHTAVIDGADAAAVERYLAGLIRRGETFVYFGPGNPFGRMGEVPRLPIARLPFWRLPLMRYGGTATPLDAGFFFEGVWFGRCAVTVDNRDAAAGVLERFSKYLYDRVVVRASARATVNLVWHFESLPDEGALKRLASLVKQTNFRFVQIRGTRGTPQPEWAGEVVQL